MRQYPLYDRGLRQALSKAKANPRVTMDPQNPMNSKQWSKGWEAVSPDDRTKLVEAPVKAKQDFDKLKTSGRLVNFLATLGYNCNFSPKTPAYGECAVVAQDWDNKARVLDPADANYNYNLITSKALIFYPMNALKIVPATRPDSLRYQRLYAYQFDTKKNEYVARPVDVTFSDARKGALSATRTAARKAALKGRYIAANVLAQLLYNKRITTQELQNLAQQAESGWKVAKQYANLCQKLQTKNFNALDEIQGKAKFYPVAGYSDQEAWVTGSDKPIDDKTRLDFVSGRVVSDASKAWAAGEGAYSTQAMQAIPDLSFKLTADPGVGPSPFAQK